MFNARLRFTLSACGFAVGGAILVYNAALQLPSTIGMFLFFLMLPMSASVFIGLGHSTRGLSQAFAVGAAVPMVLGSVFAYDYCFVEFVSLAASNDLLTYPYVLLYSKGRDFMAVFFAAAILVSFVSGLAAMGTAALIRRNPGRAQDRAG